MENSYMYPITQSIADVFDNYNLIYDCRINGEQETLVLPFVISGGGPSALMCITNKDNDPDTAIRVYGLLNEVPEDRRQTVSQVCNRLNRRVRYVKFLLDEDGDVNVEYDIPISTPRDAVGEIVVELFSRTRIILRENYKFFARAAFSDEVDDSIHFDFSSIQHMLQVSQESPDDYIDADE